MDSMTSYSSGQAILGTAVVQSSNFSDAEFSSRVNAGLSVIWQAAFPQLKRLVAALGCAHAAEDILQDVYLIAMQKGPHNPDPLSLRRWLFRVTINRCHQENRKRKLHRKILPKLAKWFHQQKQAPSVAQTIGNRQQHRAVHSALQALDESHKVPLVLRYFHDLNSSQIAKILEIPDSTVRSRLRRARAKLAIALGPEAYDHE